jgi:hypothetical protein
MFEKIKINKIFKEFKSNVDFEKEKNIWKKQSLQFKDFWENKILNDDYSELSEFEMDKIILFFDSRAKGAKKFKEEGGTHAALAHIHQIQWYEALKSIKRNIDIRELLDKILKSDNNDKKKLITNLKKINDKYGNNLTGEKGIVLNAILFVYSPDKYVSILSLDHRYKLLKFFKFGNKEDYETYGEKIIRTNEDIINGFRNKYNIEVTTHLLSYFIYSFLQKEINWRNIKNLK